ncbi:MAG: dual specificity protein phosphatase family protein [Planctomycetota bacterium]
MDTLRKLKDRYNFSFVIDGRVAGMSRPDRDAVAMLREAGFRGIVSLTETPLAADMVQNLEYLHLPVADFTAPTQAQLEHAARFIDYVNGPVALHCFAGIGRTGTALAAYLVWVGLEADAAIDRVRRLQPGAIETSDQEAAIHEFETHCAARQRRPAGNLAGD